jgi:hypothetical protein
MGQEKAAQYLTVLNKIANVAQFFDWTVPIEAQKQMWQTRQGFSGSCDIKFPDDVENKEDEAQKVLDDLAKGEDIVDNENMENLVSGLNIAIVSRGVDLSVLIHEAIKGIYKLPTQASLEALYGGAAEKVLMNTDTLFDELEEIKYGRQMQDAFFKIVSTHPIIVEKIGDMLRNDEEDWKISAFQEKINFLFFGKLAMIGQEDAKEFLVLINAILSDSKEAQEMCDPIIRSVIQDLAGEEEYQASRGRRPEFEPESAIEDEPIISPEPTGTKMSKREIENAIDDALDAGDFAEVERLSKMLGEGYRFPRLKFASLINETRKR